MTREAGPIDTPSTLKAAEPDLETVQRNETATRFSHELRVGAGQQVFIDQGRDALLNAAGAPLRFKGTVTVPSDGPISVTINQGTAAAKTLSGEVRLSATSGQTSTGDIFRATIDTVFHDASGKVLNAQ